MNKIRLDAYITEKTPEISRSRAKMLIEAGSVCIDGKVQTKPSFTLDASQNHLLEINTNTIPYVSRGGLKLKGALEAFNVDPSGLVCADIGASTGGFTDCLLKEGALRVYAVDSGSDQLAESLKNDPRVCSMEKFNARDLNEDTFGELCSLVVADLSFISQTLVLGPIYAVTQMNGSYIGLIKPQFECGKSALNKNGIVKDKKQHFHAIKRVISEAESVGFEIVSLIRSPISGGDGNTEFLFLAKKSDDLKLGNITDAYILGIVNKERKSEN